MVTPNQGRSQTFSFGGGTGGATFATRGAVNGLCRTFRKRPTPVAWRHAENFGGPLGRPGKILGSSGPPGTPLAPPLTPIVSEVLKCRLPNRISFDFVDRCFCRVETRACKTLRSCAMRLGVLAVTILPRASRSFNPAVHVGLSLYLLTFIGDLRYKMLLI